MIIRCRKNWKDFAEGKDHRPSLSRREFIERGLATGFTSVFLSNLIAGEFVKKALAAELNCPAPTLAPGAIAQIFSEGGPTMGARFISERQASLMNAGMAANYGISGQANLVRLGPNMVVDSTSAFGFTIMQGPPGYPGGAAAWRTNVLSKISGGAHLGPFNSDDGAGENSGLLAGVSPYKASTMGKDLKINVDKSLASWAQGLPSASVGSSTPNNLAKTFTLTPAANGLINSQALTFASEASNSIADALSEVFKNANRKGAENVKTSAGCAFFGNSALADPNYGNTLFNPTNIAALTSKVTVNTLSQAEQGLLAAYYQSARGVAGGVISQFNGRDYHGGDANDIAGKDIEEARAVVMFLAACDAAQAPGALIYFSNGQAIADGTQAANVTINGANATVQAPRAQDDAGGTYNGGLIIFYNPTGAGPVAKFTGTVDSNGRVKTDSNVGSSKEAVAGLYLSALAWVHNGAVPAEALLKMQKSGVAADRSKIMVI